MHVHLLQAQVSSAGDGEARGERRARRVAGVPDRPRARDARDQPRPRRGGAARPELVRPPVGAVPAARAQVGQDRKSTRLNSSHMSISYAVFCLKKKKKEKEMLRIETK